MEQSTPMTSSTDRLQSLIAEMLDVPESQITAQTRRADIENWDSLNHLQLVTAIETEFGLKLTMDEIAAISTVEDFHRIIAARGTKA
jgi:acyl carrier protein